jgi:hypothetical protein
MRLTADVLLRAEHYLNVYMDRELSLRGEEWRLRTGDI